MNQGRGPQTFDDMMKLMILQNLSKQNDGADPLDQTGHRAFKRMNKLREGVLQKPQKVVADYLTHVCDHLGVEPGDAWQLWQYTNRLNWGKNKGLLRFHFHISHVLTLSLKGQHHQCEAYLVQLRKAAYQLSLDGGNWSTASSLLPRADPVHRKFFGESQQELEAAASFQEALKKMRHQGPSSMPKDDKEDGPDKDKKPKGKGKGKHDGDKGENAGIIG